MSTHARCSQTVNRKKKCFLDAEKICQCETTTIQSPIREKVLSKMGSKSCSTILYGFCLQHSHFYCSNIDKDHKIYTNIKTCSIDLFWKRVYIRGATHCEAYEKNLGNIYKGTIDYFQKSTNHSRMISIEQAMPFFYEID